MKQIVDTYLGNLTSKSVKEVLAVKNNLGKCNVKNVKLSQPEKFLTVAQARELVEKYKVELYGVVSMGSWYHDGKYIGVNGRFGEIDSQDPEKFFLSINYARFEIAEFKKPNNEFRYAMIGGDFPDELVPYLKKYRYLFDGVKIGAFRPREFQFNDPKYLPLRDFCNERALPIVIHCKSKNPQNFIDLYNLSRKYSKIRFCASHLGGEFEYLIEKRAEFLMQTHIIPGNFYLNLAVKDLNLAMILLKNNPRLIHNIIFSADYPFLGEYDEIISKTQDLFSPEQIKIIQENGKRFLGKIGKLNRSS